MSTGGDTRLAGKTALITGAGSGIGKAIARTFSDSGARVILGDISEEAVRQTANEIDGALPLQVDVSSADSMKSFIDRAYSESGQIDILCNNAGIGSTQNVADEDVDTWDQVFGVNARGVFLGCKYVIPRMIEHGGGTIVNTASVAGLIGLNNRAAYCASKGAVIALTKQIAVSYVKDGIRCNCVCPGTVDSPWVGRLLEAAGDPAAERANLIARQPMGRLGQPEEVARAVLYLASDDSAFMTGSELVIDGGILAQ